MSSSAINAQLFQAKIGSIQNQADTSAVYSAGVWSFKNSTALTSVTITDAGAVTLGPSGFTGNHVVNGNVGIGTASPQAALHINRGTSGAEVLRLQGGTGAGNDPFLSWYRSDGSVRNGYIQVSPGNFSLGLQGSGVMDFAINGQSCARIQSSANFSIGRTADHQSRLYITRGNTSTTWDNQTLTLEQTSNPAAPGIGFHAATHSTAGIFKFWGPNSEFECRNSADTGFINIKANACIDMSDYRLKKEVAPLESGLEKALKLKPCHFTWIADDRKNLGFIAHELQEVIPEAVYGEKDAVREDGSADYQGLNNNAVIAVLAKAIQEQQAQIEALKAEVAALKAP